MKPIPDPTYSFGEELAHALTHGLGVLLSIGAGAVLITLATLAGDPWLVTGVSVFVGSLVLLYTASTLYHAIPDPVVKERLKTFDHCAIFVLIAGTYTPFLLDGLRGPLGWTLFAVVWGLAVVGVILKLFFTGRFKRISTLVYVAMGWLIVVAFGPLQASVSPAAVAWLVAGGVAYTAGAGVYLSTRRYAHAVWHGFVLAGSVCHFAAVMAEVLHATA